MYPNILKLNSVTITNSKLSIMNKLYVIRSKMVNHLKSSCNSNTPVSYTHLDVYKRQVHNVCHI